MVEGVPVVDTHRRRSHDRGRGQAADQHDRGGDGRDDGAAALATLYAFERFEQGGHRRPAGGRVGRQPTLNDGQQRGRHLHSSSRRSDGFSRSVAEQALVQSDTKTVLVAREARWRAVETLRSQIGRSAGDDALGRRHGQGRGPLECLGCGPGRQTLVQPEIGDPHAAIGADQHVRRLEVSVHQPDRVHVRQASAGFEKHRHRF